MEIAYHLRLPLYKLLREMPYDELTMWFEYFEKRPVGWREDLRSYYAIKMENPKAPVDKMFPSIGKLSKNNENDKMVNSLKTSKLFLNMLDAVNGDKLEFL
jgi:hypothetical protein